MYVLCCDLFFSRIYRNVSDRNSFRPKTPIYCISWHLPSPMSLESLCVLYFYFSLFYLKVSLNEIHWKLQKTLSLQIEMFLLLSVHITCMYIYTCTLVKWKYYKNWGENTNLPTTYGICSTVTRIFRRAGFFQKSREFHYFYVSYQIRTHNHS